MAEDFEIKRSQYVIFNPESELWEVWEMTPAEAFLLDLDRWGAQTAVENMGWPIVTTATDESDEDGLH